MIEKALTTLLLRMLQKWFFCWWLRCRFSTGLPELDIWRTRNVSYFSSNLWLTFEPHFKLAIFKANDYQELYHVKSMGILCLYLVVANMNGVFCPSEGVMTVTAKKSWQLQAEQMHLIGHNVSREDVLNLFMSQSFSTKIPQGYLDILLFTI